MGHPSLLVYQSKPDVISAVTATASSANSSAFAIPRNTQVAMFLFDVTTGSGTTPTLDIAIQTSPDEGSTYYNVFRAIQITAVSINRLICDFSSFGGNTATTATNAGGGNAAAITLATSGALTAGAPIIPEYMRIRYVIGGTNPSFAFTTDVIYGLVGSGKR